MIPYGNHTIDQDDIDAVVDVLKNQFLTQGQQVPAFEKALGDYCKVDYVAAVNSGTSALHIACLALGLNKNGRLWTTANTFVASANCALYCGAEVDFVDIDATTRNISISALSTKLEQAKKNDCLPDILVAVHFAGLSCDMKALATLSKNYGFKIIEDASHALGGQYSHQPIGCCEYSDISILSFHPVKQITTAEGGAALTNSEAIYKLLRLFSQHGVTRDEELILDEYKSESDGPWYYQQVELGYNYRLSDIHAALGISQLKKLDSSTKKRHVLAKRYHQALAHLPINLPVEYEDAYSAWHIYTIELDHKKYNEQDRLAIFKRLQARGVGVNVHYIPVHLQAYYQKLGFKHGDFPITEAYYKHAITLPLFPRLSFAQQDTVISVCEEVLAI